MQHFEWICSLPESIIDQEYFTNTATVDLKNAVEHEWVFGRNVQFIQALLTRVVDSSSIRVKRTDSIRENETIDDIPEEIVRFDYLVIWTGSTYKLNENDVNDVYNIFSKEQRLRLLSSYENQINQAESILVVGGGATGTECLGEIQHKYRRSKMYGLMNSQTELLNGLPQRAKNKALYSHVYNI